MMFYVSGNKYLTQRNVVSDNKNIDFNYFVFFLIKES